MALAPLKDSVGLGRGHRQALLDQAGMQRRAQGQDVVVEVVAAVVQVAAIGRTLADAQVRPGLACSV
jgi:hypothetical protein